MGVDLNMISTKLRSIEETVQPGVLELNVGVNHIALAEERERQLSIQQQVESVISSLHQLKPTEVVMELKKANRLMKVTKGNTDTLKYLQNISCMESLLSDVVKAFTLTSVNLSSECAASDTVFSTRFLEKNVQQCWEYASQLSVLASMHLKAAADFHQFTHSLKEIRHHARRMLNLSKRTMQGFLTTGQINDASKLHSELLSRLRIFRDLSERTKKLVNNSECISPIENRLVSVKNGQTGAGSPISSPIKVQALISFAGEKYTIKKGEILPLVDTTEHSYLWKVKTSQGMQFIPSVACIVVSSNDSLKAEALSTGREVCEAWKNSLSNYRKLLINYYTKYLRTFTIQEQLQYVLSSSKIVFPLSAYLTVLLKAISFLP